MKELLLEIRLQLLQFAINFSCFCSWLKVLVLVMGRLRIGSLALSLLAENLFFMPLETSPFRLCKMKTNFSFIA